MSVSGMDIEGNDVEDKGFMLRASSFEAPAGRGWGMSWGFSGRSTGF